MLKATTLGWATTAPWMYPSPFHCLALEFLRRQCFDAQCVRINMSPTTQARPARTQHNHSPGVTYHAAGIGLMTGKTCSVLVMGSLLLGREGSQNVTLVLGLHEFLARPERFELPTPWFVGCIALARK